MEHQAPQRRRTRRTQTRLRTFNAGASWGRGDWGTPHAVVYQWTCREPVQRLKSWRQRSEGGRVDV